MMRAAELMKAATRKRIKAATNAGAALLLFSGFSGSGSGGFGTQDMKSAAGTKPALHKQRS